MTANRRSLRCFVVEGASMEPRLREGDLVFVSGSGSRPRPGDVVVYLHPDHGFPVVHRIGDRVCCGFTMRGDANASDDPLPVDPSRVLGRVRWVLPRLGRVALALRGRASR